MKITYDKQVDAMYIRLNDKATYKKSKKITDDVLVDYAENGQVIGVEILEASKNSFAPLKKSSIPIEISALRS